MATPTVVIDNSTGSNTAASGAGPATALTGTAAAFAASVVTLDGSPSLAGVATDGSHVLWLKTSTGRQYFTITAKDDTLKTVTVADAPAGTATGRTWAIGGKRSTLDHADTRPVFVDWKAGWTVDIQQTGVDYTLTSAVIVIATTNTATVALPFTVKSSSATRPLITTSTNSINLFDVSSSDPIIFKHLSMSNTAGTKGSYAAGTGSAITPKTSANQGLTVLDCVFDGFTSALCGDNVVNYQFGNGLTVIGTEIKNCTENGINYMLPASGPLSLDRCYIHDCGGDGVTCPTGGGTVVCCYTTLTNNGGRGFYQSSSSLHGTAIYFFVNNSCKGNGQSGIELNDNGYILVAHDNIFVANLDDGIKLSATEATYNSAKPAPVLFRNAYKSNANGTAVNGPPDSGDNITLTVDPFNSASDYGLNATAGGGALVRNATPNAPNVSNNADADAGAIPSGGGAGAILSAVAKLAGVAGLAG